MGYEPVLHERGSIPYGKEFSLEDYCYKEIQLSDIVVSIIGGRYGSESNEKPYSISQNELKTGFKLDKQVYIFIEKNVLAEYDTYLKNKNKNEIEFHYVNNKKIYEFIDDVYNISANNQIFPFESSEEIIDYLKTQWAGLFQRLLQEESKKTEILIVEKLSETADSLDKMLNYLKGTNSEKSEIIQNILSTRHPVFQQIKEILQIRHRVFFENFEEMDQVLRSRNWKLVSNIYWDSPTVAEWSRRHYLGDGKTATQFLHISKKIFDPSGKLLNMSDQEWSKNFIFITEEIDPENEKKTK